MNAYKEMLEAHQKELYSFPIVWAFGQKQFVQAMQKLGLDPEKDVDKVTSVFGGGDIVRKDDVPALLALLDRHHAEMKAAIEADKTGNGFIFDMFNYELSNHEYAYTGDCGDALRACGISDEDLASNKALRHGLRKAKKAQKDCF